jgi:hypothetical protein
MTVIADTLHEKMNETRVQTLVRSWLTADDVFRPEFLQNILFISSVADKRHAKPARLAAGN